MKKILTLKKEIIYGPVNSRRLGQSLGINILPPGKKICPFNCVYCQYGWTKIHTSRVSRNIGLPSVYEIRNALEEALKSMSSKPAYITFSGNGEPTLHPDFGKIVETLIAVRDHLAPKAKTAVLSNSALVNKPAVREALSKLDVRIMKLDCGSYERFLLYNQPCFPVNLESLTEGLENLSGVTIQTLISSGKSGNLGAKNIRTWIERLKRIKPVSVQLYTLDRGYPQENLKSATKKELHQIKTLVQKEGISVEIF